MLRPPTYTHTSCTRDTVGDGLGGSIDAWSGLTVDDAEFGAGASTCTTFVDPWSGPGGAELDHVCASDDSIGFPHNLWKYFSHSRSNGSPRFPNTPITSSGMCTTSMMLNVSHVPVQEP
jgi:hypothetical protein